MFLRQSILSTLFLLSSVTLPIGAIHGSPIDEKFRIRLRQAALLAFDLKTYDQTESAQKMSWSDQPVSNEELRMLANDLTSEQLVSHLLTIKFKSINDILTVLDAIRSSPVFDKGLSSEQKNSTEMMHAFYSRLHMHASFSGEEVSIESNAETNFKLLEHLKPGNLQGGYLDDYILNLVITRLQKNAEGLSILDLIKLPDSAEKLDLYKT